MILNAFYRSISLDPTIKYLGIIKNQTLKPCAARAAGGEGFSGFVFHSDHLPPNSGRRRVLGFYI
jgi:hypothetical protein